MGTHARLSASTAHRWMVCTGSVALAESLGHEDRGSSEYAREGSAAHAFGEWLIRTDLEGTVEADDYVGVGVVVHDREADDYEFSPDGVLPEAADSAFEIWPVTEDMADAVQVYLDHVRALRETADFEVDAEYLEKNLDMKWLHPDFGGTGDHILVRSFHSMDVTDYKHGRGVVVEAVDNEQGLKYGVGARHLHPEVDEVTVHIVQPRAPHHEGPVRSATYTRAEMDAFETRLVAAAEEVNRPNAPLRAGDHCKFCPALGVCPEARGEAERQAAADFADDPDDFEQDDVTALTTGQLAESLRWVKFLDAWCKAVEGEGFHRRMRGEEVTGYKLVRKKTNRRLTLPDDEVVSRMRKGAKVLKGDCFKPAVIKSPAQLEKLGANRKLTKAVVAEMTEKPMGELTLVADSDPRPEVDPEEEKAQAAAADFDEG